MFFQKLRKKSKMITKIRKYQDSWITKSILALTALSFMSLFGVSGYVSSAGKNRAVIKVDNLEILQDEMNFKHQNNIRRTQSMFGDALEINEEMSKKILDDLVKKELADMIIARKAQKENVSISDELIKKIISSQPEFMDNSGNFNPEFLRRQLAYFDMSEQDYINNIKRNVLHHHLVSSPVEKITFPHFMSKYFSQIKNQQKVFNYVEINPADIKVDREISDEEIEQYYQDFAPQFEEPEKRNLSFIELRFDDLTKNIIPSEKEIKDFYDDNSSEYIIPEKRNILQMVTSTKEEADKAYKLLSDGADFYKVAADIANQDKSTTDLGKVSADSLLPELTDDVFDAKLNQIVGPINSEFGWHILKVNQITPKKETPLSDVRSKIIATIKQEQAYDEASRIITEIEDKIGSGATFDEIANEFNAKTNLVKGLKEDGSFVSISNKKYADLVKSTDFTELAFSYNKNEISQALETENGFVFATITDINEAHVKDLSLVKPIISKMWTENEKSAIAQEMANDVVADLDNGETLSDISNRFKLKMHTTAPLKRNETFGKLNKAQYSEAFQVPTGEYKVLSSNSITTIVIPVKVINNNTDANSKHLEEINDEMQNTFEEDLQSELIDKYSKDMDVRVKYRLLGLAD